MAGECTVGADNMLRIYTVDPTPPIGDCFDSGVNNITGENWDDVDLLGPLPGYTTVYGEINRAEDYESGDVTNGALTLNFEDGTFSISGVTGVPWILALKQADTWAAFYLPLSVLSGTFEVCKADDKGCTSMISHGMIIGGDELSVVPIPAAAWLLGSGLVGLFAMGRRRRTDKVVAA